MGLLASTIPCSWSLTIVRQFIGGERGESDIGEGNLHDIVNAAADIWELAIFDEHVLTLRYGWAPNGGGEHYLDAQGGTPHRETAGTILFNNDDVVGHHHFYLDPTPWESSEYPSFEEGSIDLGGGSLNGTRAFSRGPQSEDLLSTVLHEIGHALGISMANQSFIDEIKDGDIDVRSPVPHAGTRIEVQSNNFGYTSHIVYTPPWTVTSGANGVQWRTLPTALDMVVLGQLSGFTNLNLNLASKLKITNDGNVVVLSWLAPLGKFVLEQSTGSPLAGWTPVEDPIEVVNGFYSVRVPPERGTRLYRLRRTASR
jgi:hypothetical protein